MITLRKNLGLTQKAIADKLGISQERYCYIEIRAQKIPNDIQEALCEALHCSLADLGLEAEKLPQMPTTSPTEELVDLILGLKPESRAMLCGIARMYYAKEHKKPLDADLQAIMNTPIEKAEAQGEKTEE